MSSLTPCNRCTLAQIMKRAEATGRVVVCITKADGSVDVISYPAAETPDLERHRVAWFMRLTDECACD